MAYQLTVSCNLAYGFLRCSLPADATDIYLKVKTLKRIPIYTKDSKVTGN